MRITQKITELKIILFDPDFEEKKKSQIKEIDGSFGSENSIIFHAVQTILNINRSLPSRGKKSSKVGLSKYAIIAKIKKLLQNHHQ